MKVMLKTDFLVARSMLLQMVGICIFVGIVMCYFMGSTVAGCAAIAAMVPFMYLFSISALDEQNGWERFRLTLPLSRRQVVFGRYASVFVVTLGVAVFAALLGLIIAWVAGVLAPYLPDLHFEELTFEAAPPLAIFASTFLCSFVILMGSAVALPLIARFGMSKATRIAPLVVVIVLAFGVGFLGNAETSFDFMKTLEVWVDTGALGNLALVFVGVYLVGLIAYIVSAFVATKLYEQRQF